MSDEEDAQLPKIRYLDDVAEEPTSARDTKLYLPEQMLARGEPQAPWFVVVRGRRSAGKHYALREGATIGRAIGNDIELSENGVSRRHVRIKLLPGGRVLAEDLGSSNGIFVGGEKRKNAILAEGDRVQVGDAELVLLFIDTPSGQPERAVLVDAATGLPNRRQLLQNITSDLEYASSFGAKVGLLAIGVNDWHDLVVERGRDAANEVLKEAARSISNLVRVDGSSCGRYAEDSLLLVLPDTDETQLTRAAEWIARSVTSRLEPAVSLSIGVTFTSGAEVDAKALVARATRNRYRATLVGGGATDATE